MQEQNNLEHAHSDCETASSCHDLKSNGLASKDVPIARLDRIELTPVQQQRVQNFRRQIEPLRAQAAALEQGIHAMLSTLIELKGVADGANYSLTDDATALVLTPEAKK